MDGFPFLPAEVIQFSRGSALQHTLRAPINCSGIGLHSGLPITVRLLPAPEGHGVVFHRVDLDVVIPARFDTVVDTRMCTVIGLAGQPEARVGTIEHLMAAFSAAGLDNVRVEVDGPEVPVLDGSSEPWLFLIDCAGLEPQAASRARIEVLRTVRVQQGDAFAELRPNAGAGTLEMAMSIEFDAAAIGRQALSFTMDGPAFRRELARARTFAQRHEIAALQRAGLARGGSLENAIVVDGAEVLNPAGLRCADEFVRHKLLDAVGDLALAVAPLQARFVASKSGHALNNRVLRALFADTANWRFAPTEALVAA